MSVTSPRLLCFRWRAGRAILAALFLVGATPAAAAGPDLATVQRLDARVQSIGWRLAAGNARFCPDARLGIGLQLHDVYNYADPPAVRRALGLASDIAVAAVADSGPAARAGLAVNDALGEVAGQSAARLPAVKAGDYARLAGLHDRIDAALAARGAAEFEVLRAGGPVRVAVVGELACVSRFEMLTDGNRAAADGARVVVSDKLVAFLAEDEQLAALLAHELAHNVLGHRARLNAVGRTWGNIRTTEREADRLSVWLLANAGYDPAAALRFMAHWGPANDLGILSTPDHDRWRSRYRLIEQELAALAQARAGDPAGEANWPRDFRPQDSRSQVSGPK